MLTNSDIAAVYIDLCILQFILTLKSTQRMMHEIIFIMLVNFIMRVKREKQCWAEACVSHIMRETWQVWNWAILEKKRIGVGVLRIWNFQGYWRKSNCIFQRLIKNNVKFPGVTKQKSCGTYIRVFILGLKISDACNTYLWNFSEWSFVLSGISKGKVKNLKFDRVFQRSGLVG